MSALLGTKSGPWEARDIQRGLESSSLDNWKVKGQPFRIVATDSWGWGHGRESQSWEGHHGSYRAKVTC